MDDLKKTLKSFAKAKVASILPLADLNAVSTAFAERRGEYLRSKARRENLTHRVTGRLCFERSLAEGKPKPLPYMQVELWDEGFGPDAYLGSVETDAEGRFTITYDPRDTRPLGSPRLELRIVDHYHGHEKVLWVVEGPEDEPGETCAFGDIGVPYYEYHETIPLPHLRTIDFGEAEYDAMPQSYRVGRTAALAENASAVYAVRLGHYTIDSDASLPEIQADYAGKTSYSPPSGPGEAASADAHFVYKMLNGNCPTSLTEFEKQYHVVHVWDAYEFDGEHYLPNVHAVFDYDGETLTPVSITIRERLDNATAPYSPLGEPVTHRPGDAGWAYAKHVFECSNYLHTQAANHLARGHFNAEQFAMAAWRNLRRSPLRDLLFPHLQEVMIINVEGEAAIFGSEGLITKNSALTGTSLVQAILAEADTDWWGWRPRTPLGPQHQFAHVANIYWEVLGEYVDGFFAEHLDDIERHWGEARGFSDDLVAHSVPYRPIPLPEGHRRVDANEFAKPDAPRVEVGGALRTVTPIVTRDTPDDAQLKDMKQACRYAIFHATLWHSWTNDTTDSLEPSYSQYNVKDRSTTKELTDHISVNLALSQTRYGMILENEDGDIPQGLVDALEARRDDFAAVGYDPARIRSRINI